VNDLERLLCVAGGRSWALEHPGLSFTRAAVVSCGERMGALGTCEQASVPAEPDWLDTPLPEKGSLWLVDKRHAYLTAMREVTLEGLPGTPYRPLAEWGMRALDAAWGSGDEVGRDWVKAVYRVGIGCLPLRGHADWRAAIIAHHVDLMAVMLASLRMYGVPVYGQGKTDAFLVWSAGDFPPAGIRSKAQPFSLEIALELLDGPHPPRTLSALVAQARRRQVMPR
jgi:hypothetical protein